VRLGAISPTVDVRCGGDEAKNEAGIKGWGALAARPRTALPALDGLSTGWTLIAIAEWAPQGWHEAGANLVKGGAGQLGDAKSDPVVPVLRMPAVVAIKEVAHVQQLLGHDDLDRLWLSQIDPQQIDQHEVSFVERMIDISSTDCRLNPAPEPALELTAIGGNPQAICGQR